MLEGCYTAIITPFNGDVVDHDGLDALVAFQIKNGISGVLAAGTTGESPVLSWDEHNRVIEAVARSTSGKCRCIAGTGSNNTRESLAATEHAVKAGVDAVLLVDPYYNGPSSLEIRREYVAPVAKAFPEVQVIPYVIPGRTGAQLLPEDLAILSKSHPNVRSVKEATGNLENMRTHPGLLRSGLHDSLRRRRHDLCHDDGPTNHGRRRDLRGVQRRTGQPSSAWSTCCAKTDKTKRGICLSAIEPLFGLVTVKTTEKTPYGEVVCRARNPLAVKALMSILGMPSGGCRQPLGKMTRNGIDVVLRAARTVQKANPEIFKPVEDFFGVNISERLENPSNWENLYYKEY